MVHRCPTCGDIMDWWPEDAKVGYCFTCHKTKSLESEETRKGKE
jgi:hypothetical protein